MSVREERMCERLTSSNGSAKGPAFDDDDGAKEMYEWRWGTRALCEVGEEGIARFIAEFMVEDLNGDEDAPNTQKTKARYDKMYEGIEKAAGAKLTDVK